jgi:hypothetical protein
MEKLLGIPLRLNRLLENSAIWVVNGTSRLHENGWKPNGIF